MPWIAVGAGVLFGLALLCLVAFFVTKDARFDRIAEWAFVGFAVLAVPTIVAANGQLAGGALEALVMWAGILGVGFIGLGELAITLRLIEFRRVAAVITMGFLAFLAWIGAVSVLAIANGALPVELGWLGIVSIALGILIVAWLASQPGVLTAEREPSRIQMGAFLVPMAGIVVWLVWLGFSL
ncbi:MAG: hypothetical protein FIA92_14630 [Chloroflexi bacterium]|nr:hypothetical protein [Chloroflexota bacterium]